MLGLPQLYVLTSLSTTQTRALAASSLMLRRVRLDSRLVHRVRANTKSKPLMALSEFVARSVAVLYLRAGGRRSVMNSRRFQLRKCIRSLTGREHIAGYRKRDPRDRRPAGKPQDTSAGPPGYRGSAPQNE